MKAKLILALAYLACAPAALAQQAPPPTPAPAPSLAGKFLVADPSMPDPRFAGTVVFMIAHSPSEGALGVVINRVGARRTVGELMRAFSLAPKDGKGIEGEVDLFWGGPVGVDSVLLVLHSDEFKVPSTKPIAPGVALSQPGEMLEAFA